MLSQEETAQRRESAAESHLATEPGDAGASLLRTPSTGLDHRASSRRTSMVTLSLTRTVGATHPNKSMQTSNNCATTHSRNTYALEPPPRGTSSRRRRRLAHCNSPPRPQRARSREGTARRAQTALHSTPPQRRSRSRVPATHYAAGGPSPSASRRATASQSTSTAPRCRPTFTPQGNDPRLDRLRNAGHSAAAAGVPGEGARRRARAGGQVRDDGRK